MSERQEDYIEELKKQVNRQDRIIRIKDAALHDARAMLSRESFPMTKVFNKLSDGMEPAEWLLLLTARDGILWDCENDFLQAGTADIAARAYGFNYAEELVKYLEGQQ